MGVFDDPKFNLTNVFDVNFNRNYRISYLDPMNSNIAVVLYECNSSHAKYTLRAFHNEHLVKLNGCSSLNCDLNEFTLNLSKFKEHCVSSESVCKINTSGALANSSSLIHVTLALLFFYFYLYNEN